MLLDDMPSWRIRRQSVYGEGDMAVCYSTGDYLVSVMDPDQESLIKAIDKIVAVMDGNSKKYQKIIDIDTLLLYT